MTFTSLPVLAAAEWGGEFEGALDDINALFDFPPVIELSIAGLDLSINRTILIAWFMTLVVAVLFGLAFRKPEIVPGKLQAACEAIVDFVRNGIALEIIGQRGLKFVPLLTTMLVTIFLLNLAKITPFIMMPPTSRMAWPFFFALLAWVIYLVVGFREHGVLGYLKQNAFPEGVPKVAYVLITPIELLTVIVLRPFTLAIRLFANMVAGHILVVLTLVAIHVFLHPAQGFGIGIGVFALAASPVVFAFELLIISLQAYIFTLLTAVYIDSSLEAH
ncbi:ATP synthase F0 subunit A [Egibacter rhizosphaerae]|uniref:ATP synthase subunit a n=1 Tax=Egibacter rhizosphaerae TaxID=1670831 RepID=A0A411YD13_9ACTN|nr:F0F1 ATP synthase subunit A [Egibacter rhizosphaerae]QBI19121.1 ATP synthase F0 subunit A [Egibacter rhizosphaerae]